MLGRVLCVLPALVVWAASAEAANITSFPQLTLVTDPTNTFVAELVPWGTTYTEGVDYTQSGSYLTGSFPAQLQYQWNWPMPTGTATVAAGCLGVCTYDYLSYADYLGHFLSPVPPLELGRTTAFLSTANLSYSGQLGGFSVLYDTYETSIPHGGTANRVFEMEVFLHTSNDAAKWLNWLTNRLPDYTDANGVVWHVVEHQTQSFNPNFPDVLFWRADGSDMHSVSIHLLAMLQYAASFGYGSETNYVNGTSLGVEVAYGQGTLTYNSFTGLLE